jgi:hypothetical protein
MVIKRVGPVSVAKNVGILYALLGLVVGLIFSLISLAGGFAASDESGFGAGVGAMLGVGAVIAFPIFYACMGFIGALIGAALYNLAAGMVGGVEVEVE